MYIVYPSYDDSHLFDNIYFGQPMVVFSHGKKQAILDHFYTQGMFPIVEITDRKHPMFKQMDALPKPQDDWIISAVVLCISYNENYLA